MRSIFHAIVSPPCVNCVLLRQIRSGLIFDCVLGSVLLLFALGILGQAFARDANAPAEQHRYIDSVLVPRFYAAWSDWAIQHPQDKGKQGSHYFTVDAGDVRRGHVMREAMKELYDRLREIGY